MAKKHFIILIGGPARFQSCDKAHDQTWTNYIVPMQLAASRNLFKKAPDEALHWVVYEPPYVHRWADDSQITVAERKQDDGAWLHGIRKKAADKVVTRGASNYLHRIKLVASEVRATYKGIKKPAEFWKYLETFPKGSISRIWYSGHATRSGLMLALAHDTACQPIAHAADMIVISDIKSQAGLADKFDQETAGASEFYGCQPADFAKQWHTTFAVPSEGAVRKIDFGVVDRPSKIVDILERIREADTSSGDPKWSYYR